MAKILAIIGYSQETVDMYASQINSLFSGMLGVRKYSLNTKMPKERIDADIILAESYDAYRRVKDRLPDRRCRGPPHQPELRRLTGADGVPAPGAAFR